jgi:hypothetical protein
VKYQILVPILFAAGLSVLAQEDVRVVNGVKVDLTPLHRWFVERRGERPMQHWKRLRISDVLKRVANWDACVVTLEDGSTLNILLDHFPPDIKTPIVTFKETESLMTSLRLQIEADEGNLASIARSSAVLHRRMADGLRMEIRDKRSQLAELRHRLGTERHPGPVRLEFRRARRTVFFATNTGRQYVNLAVWDTGLLPTPGL